MSLIAAVSETRAEIGIVATAFIFTMFGYVWGRVHGAPTYRELEARKRNRRYR